jgi:CrcB protein
VNWLLVALCAAVGAPVRYLVDTWLNRERHRALPVGTFTVNVTGSFVLGVVTGLTLHQGIAPEWKTAVGTGFCGALTTWSTWGFESVRLLEAGSVGLAALNVAGSLAAGLLAGAAGLGVGLLS